MDKQELLDSIRECEKASPEKLCGLRAEIARLTAERDAERAGRERAERVAVWAVVNGVAYRESGSLQYESWENGTVSIPLHEDTDDAVFSALVEACEGGKSNG